MLSGDPLPKESPPVYGWNPLPAEIAQSIDVHLCIPSKRLPVVHESISASRATSPEAPLKTVAAVNGAAECPDTSRDELARDFPPSFDDCTLSHEVAAVWRSYANAATFNEMWDRKPPPKHLKYAGNLQTTYANVEVGISKI